MAYIKQTAHRLLALLICFCLALSAAGCGREEKAALRVGVMPDLDSIPLMTAALAGLLPEEIVLEVYKSPTDRDSALFSGHLDGAVSDLLAAFLAAENEGDYRILSVTDGCYKLVTAPGGDIAAVEQLAGKTVGMSLHTIIEYAGDRMLTAGGLPPEQVEKTAVPSIPARLELLKAGQLDAAVLPEPYAAAALEAGGRLLASSTDLSLDAGVLLFNQAAFAEKGELLQALTEGYNQAVSLLNSGQADAGAAAAALGLPDALDNSLLPDYRPAAWPTIEQMEAAAAWLMDAELVSEPADPQSLLGVPAGEEAVFSGQPAGIAD